MNYDDSEVEDRICEISIGVSMIIDELREQNRTLTQIMQNTTVSGVKAAIQDTAASTHPPISGEYLTNTIAWFMHTQWTHWTRHMLDNHTPENIERWRRQIDTEYPDLSMDERGSDREWARKLIEWLRENGYTYTMGKHKERVD